ncbi:MAG: prepilin-type N-terminal cleavage/methylation domain-containing protein [Planctomycetota bacterium]
MLAGKVRRAFTLVEILIVVVILGVLAAIVAPQAANAMDDVKQTAFVGEMRTLVDAASVFRAREGYWIGDGGSGQIPAGFEDYVDEADFEAGTPIGGVWDTEARPDYDVTLAIGVHFIGGDAPTVEYMEQVDAIADDGDLATGAFQEFSSDRFYFIVEF